MFTELPKNYWENVWQDIKLPSEVKAENNVDLHSIFKRVLPSDKCRLIEVGCAPGRWLVYFNKNFNYDVSGIEYAPEAAETTRMNLEKSGIKGSILNEDFMAYEKAQTFDVVFSSGFIEHFSNTAEVVEKLTNLVSPSRYIVTIVPNLYGINGFISKTFRPRVYHGHVRITLDKLTSMHEDCGITTMFADYVEGMHIIRPIEKNFFSKMFPNISKGLNLPVDLLNDIIYNHSKKNNRFSRSSFFSNRLLYIGRR